MGASHPLRYDPAEPLGLVRWPIPATGPLAGLRAIHFEFSSRGDRVPGRLLLPAEANAKLPIVLLQHGIGGSRTAPYLDVTAAPWVPRGLAVASIDFPLHGDRTSAKLSERLEATLRKPAETSASSAALAHEFFRQAVVDLRRAMSALERLPEIDSGRAAYAGFSLGAVVGAEFCASDPRPRAAVFAIGGGGGGVGPEALDPARTIAGFAPRPALFINTTEDEVFSRESALAFFAGAGEPKQQLWFEGGHRQLPGAALKAMWLFLKGHLGVA